MKTVNIEHNNDYIDVTCPNCDHWEEQPIDQQRHHLQTFDLEWLDEENNIEVSKMTCHNCKSNFKLTWDYK